MARFCKNVPEVPVPFGMKGEKVMILKELKINTWIGDSTNCYILFDEKSKETIVIDPAGEVDRICEMIDILNR